MEWHLRMLEKLWKGFLKRQNYQEKGFTDGETLEDVGEALKGWDNWQTNQEKGVTETLKDVEEGYKGVLKGRPTKKRV